MKNNVEILTNIMHPRTLFTILKVALALRKFKSFLTIEDSFEVTSLQNHSMLQRYLLRHGAVCGKQHALNSL